MSTPSTGSASPEPVISECPAAGRAAPWFEKLVAVMAHLRAPGGCPWDAEQDHHSLAVHLIEETHETLDAIDSGDMSHLQEELGDLLLQVVFHAEIAQGDGHFEIADVLEGLVDKLIDRHPHVFGEVRVGGASEVVSNWEAQKKTEKGRTSIRQGLPRGLPALILAHKALRRASGVGYRYDASVERLQDMAGRLQQEVSEETVGDLLMEAVALAGAAGVDPEGALRRRSNQLLDDAEPR